MFTSLQSIFTSLCHANGVDVVGIGWAHRGKAVAVLKLLAGQLTIL
jgi:hypothetical protein